ncbi:MAG: RnfABCDGE type electron transport complex subunit A [Candidatus Riflebacteria bacterium]|nr:RnfABCDGE type electron transport complex subunit A [Candidatus Riflebacteria bacterium]
MTQLIGILILSIFVENFVFSQILGLCPFIGVSNKFDSAYGMGLAVTFVMFVTGIVTWPLYHLILVPLQLEYLETIAFILVIAALVQFVEIVMKKTARNLYQALGVYLPLITTNCAVLGVALINIKRNYSFAEAAVNALGGGLGFLMALLIMAGIRERLELAEIPASMKGAPIAFITGGIMAAAFIGFSGLI